MYAKSGKNRWALVLMLLAGIVLGGFIGQYAGKLPYCGWLAYGKTFGLDTPLRLNLEIIALEFALTIKFTVSGIIGMIIAVVVYKKML